MAKTLPLPREVVKTREVLLQTRSQWCLFPAHSLCTWLQTWTDFKSRWAVSHRPQCAVLGVQSVFQSPVGQRQMLFGLLGFRQGLWVLWGECPGPPGWCLTSSFPDPPLMPDADTMPTHSLHPLFLSAVPAPLFCLFCFLVFFVLFFFLSSH